MKNRTLEILARAIADAIWTEIELEKETDDKRAAGERKSPAATGPKSGKVGATKV